MGFILLGGAVIFSLLVVLLTFHFLQHAESDSPSIDLELFDPLTYSLDQSQIDAIRTRDSSPPPPYVPAQEELGTLQIQ